MKQGDEASVCEIQNSQNETRLQEIFSELSECREDERNSQNLIVQVLAATGTILGIVFAFVDLKSRERYMLFICDLVFSVAFTFIITLGIGNVLRYHYIQDLEDRLGALVPCGTDRADLVHWMSFSAPVVTRNPKHLNSRYSRIHFFCYAMATVSAILFCFFITYFLYSQIENPSCLDKAAIVYPVVFMAVSLVIFFYSCVKAKDMYWFALKSSIEKKQKRMEERLCQQNRENMSNGEGMDTSGSAVNSGKPSWMDRLRTWIYFIYPKTKDLQKMFLIVLGYIIGLAVLHAPMNLESVKQHGIRLVLVIVVVDVLVYQARYQWNDIRGLSEEAVMGMKHRLPTEVLGKRPAVMISMILVVARLCMALYLSIRYGQDMQSPLLVCVGLIVVVSVLYELVREKKCVAGVFLIVGLGYPLRVLAGIWSACPELWNLADPVSGVWTNQLTVLILLTACFFYGEFSVTIPWTCEALKQMHHTGMTVKEHYRYLFETLQGRIDQPLWQQSGDVFSPMREKAGENFFLRCEFRKCNGSDNP